MTANRLVTGLLFIAVPLVFTAGFTAGSLSTLVLGLLLLWRPRLLALPEAAG